ncbi:MAG: peptidylprolyl isomerase, partial [Verrucomicrobia bacterium]|nr:peptidylprolyl isomerase [Verrucomicrobiota bacterium]
MNQTKTIAFLGALALAAASTTFAVTATATDTNQPAAKAEPPFSDPVIAKGKDIEIKRSQLDEAFVTAKAAAAARGMQISDAERDMLQARLLDEMIVSKILAAKATAADKDKAKESAQKFIAESRKSFPSEEKFLERLKLNKLNSVNELEEKLIGEALPNLVIEREMKALVKVTDADVKKFYTDNPDKFEKPEMVKAAHILVGTKDAEGKDLTDADKAAKKKKADDLLARAKKGEDFAKLVKDNSDDPGSKDTGGEYEFPRGQMVPEFETAAFGLKKAGDISDVVTTTFGYHIIKLVAKTPSKTIPLVEASPRISEFLLRQGAGKLIPGYV